MGTMVKNKKRLSEFVTPSLDTCSREDFETWLQARNL